MLQQQLRARRARRFRTRCAEHDPVASPVPGSAPPAPSLRTQMTPAPSVSVRPPDQALRARRASLVRAALRARALDVWGRPPSPTRHHQRIQEGRQPRVGVPPCRRGVAPGRALTPSRSAAAGEQPALPRHDPPDVRSRLRSSQCIPIEEGGERPVSPGDPDPVETPPALMPLAAERTSGDPAGGGAPATTTAGRARRQALRGVLLRAPIASRSHPSQPVCSVIGRLGGRQSVTSSRSRCGRTATHSARIVTGCGPRRGHCDGQEARHEPPERTSGVHRDFCPRCDRVPVTSRSISGPSQAFAPKRRLRPPFVGAWWPSSDQPATAGGPEAGHRILPPQPCARGGYRRIAPAPVPRTGAIARNVLRTSANRVRMDARAKHQQGQLLLRQVTDDR